MSARAKQKPAAEDAWLSAEDPEALYCVEHMLDRGSSGVVYAGRRLSDNGTVAVKIIALDVPDAGDILEEVRREAEFLRQIRSPLLVELLGAFKREECLWLVMELMEVGSLADLLVIGQLTLNEEQLRESCATMCLALEALHSNKDHYVIHRDIKAKNVLVNKEGALKLADLGVAAELSTMKSKRHTVIGSPHWMAPECFSDKEYDAKADIWSLGITLLELANGEPPMADIPPLQVIFRIPKQDPPKLISKGRFSTDAVDFVHQCLTKDPTKRPSAKELLHHAFIKDKVTELQTRIKKNHNDIHTDLGLPHMKALVKKNIKKVESWREYERKQFDMEQEKFYTAALAPPMSVGDTVPLEKLNISVIKVPESKDVKAEENNNNVDEKFKDAETRVRPISVSLQNVVGRLASIKAKFEKKS